MSKRMATLLMVLIMAGLILILWRGLLQWDASPGIVPNDVQSNNQNYQP